METTTTTRTVYFLAFNGTVLSRNVDEDRQQAQMHVNRNNSRAARRGDDSKPYHILAYFVPTTPRGNFS